MANTLLTIGMISKEALRVLENNLAFTKLVNRQYDEEFGKKGGKIGDTINIRKPVSYVGRRTATLSVENSVESSVALTVATQYGVDMSFSGAELALSLDEFSNRFIVPAVAEISNMIDYDGLQLYKNVYNAVGTPGTTPATRAVVLAAGTKLDNEAAPTDNRKLVVNSAAQASLVDALTTLLNPTKQMSDQYIKGSMGNALGFDFMMDQNVAVHTVGTYGGTPLTNGVPAQGATTLVTDGWTPTTTTLNVGDVFTIANTFAVNPRNKQSTGQLRQFVVTAATTTDGSGNSTISIFPAITSTGANKTVSALPADNAAITVLGASATSTPQNLAFTRDAFAFATVELPKMPGVENSTAISKKLGLAISVTRGTDMVNHRAVTRLDLLGGWACIRPELACRIAG